MLLSASIEEDFFYSLRYYADLFLNGKQAMYSWDKLKFVMMKNIYKNLLGISTFILKDIDLWFFYDITDIHVYFLSQLYNINEIHVCGYICAFAFSFIG